MRILRLWLTDSAKSGWPVRKLLILVGLYGWLSGCLVAQAQNACLNPLSPGNFNLEKPTVCVGSPVNITDVPPTLSNAGYNFQYDGKTPIDKVPLTSAKSMIYSQPGSYTIIQGGSGNGTGTILCREVKVLPLEPIRFTAKACSGRKVLVDVLLDDNTRQYDSYIINWGDGQNSAPLSRTDIVRQQSHTYTTNYYYTIRITGRYADPVGCETPFTATQSTLQTITLSDAVLPSITKLTTTGDNSISIQYEGGTGAGVELFQKDAGGIYAPTKQKGDGSAGSFVVQTNAKQVQCFQIVAQDACEVAGQRSNEVCSLVLEATASSKVNNLTWKPYAGTVSATTPFRQYRIYRNNAPLLTLFDRNVSNQPDVNKIECGAQYCYTLEATLSGTAQTIVTSAPICVTGVNGDLPGNFSDVLVSVENNRPSLIADLPITGTSSSYTLAISRASGSSGTFLPVGTVLNSNTFIDETADPSSGQYCYQVTYVANCGLSSPPSPPVCTVFLNAQAATRIDWTAASPFVSGSVYNYTVEIADSLSGTTREIQVNSDLRYGPDPSDPTIQTQTYRIRAFSNTGQTSYSNFYTLRRNARILVPDAFTPNGDGINDEFAAKGIYVDQFRMTIYSRWGDVIYATADKRKGWDGTANGQLLAAGQYMYRIEVQDLSGLKTVRTGAVLLIR